MTHLLATTGSAVARGAPLMDKKEHRASPRLLRQRGRSRVWTAWIDYQEVPLGTTDESEAQQRLDALVARRNEQRSLAASTNKTERQTYRVYGEGQGFAIKYYDTDGKRRTHRVPTDLVVPIVTIEEAEAYAEVWFRREVGRAGATPIGVDVSALADRELFRPEMTFEQFARLWTSGEISRRYPDHVKSKETSTDDDARLRGYVYPIIGNEPMRRFEGKRGLELVDGYSMDCLPSEIPSPARRADK